jgi:rubredoxin
MRIDQSMRLYRCTYADCGYVYDPKIAEPGLGIEPGTLFEDLPIDWVCPDCGATKDYFEPIED